MSKCLLIRAAAVALFAFAVAHVQVARAGEAVSNEVFSSGTSFEQLGLGDFSPCDPERAGFDETETTVRHYWHSSVTSEVGTVTLYTGDWYYDCPREGRRTACFTNGLESGTHHYLDLTAESYLDRGVFGLDLFSAAYSNVAVRTASRESIYCDALVKFTMCEFEPELDETARIAVWAKLSGDEFSGGATTNLIVSAGFFTNRFRSVSLRDYRLDVPAAFPDGFDVTAWHRLTVRAHGDVSKSGNGGLACFSVYVDGKPVSALAEDYAICDLPKRAKDYFSPEARALCAARRLFPCRCVPASDRALTISRFTFLGNGGIDDVSFSSGDSGFGASEKVFTLKWDDGVKALEYALGDGDPVSVAVSTNRSLDILLGTAATNGLVLRVTRCEYDAANGFTNGVWLGSNGATATNVNATATAGEFVFDGTTRNPVASVASARETVDVGGKDGYRTFKAAFAALDRSTNRVLRLLSNVDVSLAADAYGYSDEGAVCATNAAGEYILDLNGYTLRGQGGKYPTVVVNCRSFRICDTSADKTGCVKPAGDYLNPTDLFNTAVLVYPRAESGNAVEPVLTIEAGRYEGWVRNRVNHEAQVPLVGTVFVEGGSYVSTNDATFYLDACVTNPTLQYAYRQGYWALRPETNLVIWTGLGDGRRWADPKNWKVLRPPESTETALFPSRAAGLGPWTVDVGSGAMTTRSLAMEGDVFLSGTNDFVGVEHVGDGLGRLCGDAQLVYEGDVPGSLAPLLGADWAGTVVLRNIGFATSKTQIPKVLRHLETWGTENSTVVFNGVRGYVMDVPSQTLPYGFVLEDYASGSVTNAAWQNDSGYTGSTIAFLGALSGRGTFLSGANARALLQLFKFANVTNFYGKFAVNGKRVLIGSETVASSEAGLIAFGDHAIVRSDLGWTCRTAAFGEKIRILGATNDVLVRCTAAAPDVTCCTNVTLNGRPGIAWLACTNEPAWSVYVTGERPAYVPAPDPTEPKALHASAVFGSAPTVVDGYSLAALRVAAYAEAVEAVEDASVSLSLEGDTVVVSVANATAGLWYGVRHRASLAAEWDPISAGDWVRAEGTSVSIAVEKTGETGFYGIVVSYADPTGGTDD